MAKREEPILGCQNVDCIYRQKYLGTCEYYLRNAHSRTFLHKNEPGVDINNPCREYTPGGDN